ncbi:hypothetical protein BLS_000111 [Venturia inaequalis]|uniref:Stress response RCI peptide n=1 Tax=Venturia inaequalis TaxID=5025 RepID=A0A8H3U248_VENIN|nr:hypothetical protein EG328_001176 [Venturia inaequalis]KAE9962618.1 hypothetical protein BLS_000111 [Venturia inaequalis]
MCDGPDLFLCLLAILFPPIAVWVKKGICSCDSMINIALCCLGFLPGLIHAWYIVSSNPDPGYERVNDGETHVVYYVSTQPQGGYGGVAPQSQFPGQQGGTANAFRKPQPKSGRKSQAPPPQATTAPPADSEVGEGSSSNPDVPPPTYQDAIGDHKVQR